MTTLPYKKRIMAFYGEQFEPLDLSISTGSSPTPSTGSIKTSNSTDSPAPINFSSIRIVTNAINCTNEVNLTTGGLLTTANGLFKCGACTHTFTHFERLRAHQRRHKIKQSGRYTCGLCKKSFVQQSSLITHQRIHTGERPYHCKVCRNSYGDLSTFTKHKRTHSGEKPYKCGLCDRRFSQSGNCLRHTRSVHAKQLYLK